MGQGSAEHLAMAAAAVVLAVSLSLAARRNRDARWIPLASRGLGAALLVSYLVFWLVDLLAGRITARSDLPLDLSDLVVFVAAYALWTGRPLAVELTYFWGLTATVQALLTPSLGEGFPHPRWWWFALAHGGVLIAAVFLTWGVGHVPRRGSVLRVTGISLAVAAAVGVADVVLDANYMFLRRPPAEASLLDLLGPWPVYLFGAAALAVALFSILDLPFRGRSRRPDAASRPAAAPGTRM